MKVFIARYEHKYGQDVRVFATEGAAERWQQEIAVQWWEREMGNKPKPATNEEASAAYWQVMADSAREYFEINTAEVEE